MKAAREYKKLVNRLRAKYGKKNGVIPGGCFDIPSAWIKESKSKNNKKNYRKV